MAKLKLGIKLSQQERGRAKVLEWNHACSQKELRLKDRVRTYSQNELKLKNRVRTYKEKRPEGSNIFFALIYFLLI